jgi:AcrR family transcriptional regulator
MTSVAVIVGRISAVARWQSDPRGRLAKAAMELYADRGFDATTVADIAARAGLTERTFFRHFADKREVLFAGSAKLQEVMVAAVREAPPSVPAIEAVAAGVAAAATFLTDQEFSRRRQRLIDSNPVLQERELIKGSRLGAAFAAALRERGVPEPTASVTAETGIAVFRVAFERWVNGTHGGSLGEMIQEGFRALTTAVANRTPN